MSKYEDMFNKYFSNDEFNGDSDKREIALSTFVKMMETLESINITDKFITKYLDNLEQHMSEKDTGDISSLFNEDGNMILPMFSDTSEMIENSGLTFDEVIIVKEDDGEYLVTETWITEDEEMIVTQKYYLAPDIFDTKETNIKIEIVDQMISCNYIEGITNNYLNDLPPSTQLKYYKLLLDDSVEKEIFEESAKYRDKITSLEEVM